jgi:hypothetical protein
MRALEALVPGSSGEQVTVERLLAMRAHDLDSLCGRLAHGLKLPVARTPADRAARRPSQSALRDVCEGAGVTAGRLVLVAATVALAASFGASASGSGRQGRAFSPHVDNSWFPLRPGSTLVYHGVKDGKPSRDIFHVTTRTRTIVGARCIAVSDRLYLSGRLAERTTDWYSQDGRGNVWYFGESTAELDANGRVTSREGTWQAGRDGARAGIFMPARPTVGFSARQEYYKGHAEDEFRVLSRRATVRTPAASSHRALLTKETTPLEPGVVDHKYYVRGIGTVLEQTVQGGDERNTLVSFNR